MWCVQCEQPAVTTTVVTIKQGSGNGICEPYGDSSNLLTVANEIRTSFLAWKSFYYTDWSVFCGDVIHS